MVAFSGESGRIFESSMLGEYPRNSEAYQAVFEQHFRPLRDLIKKIRDKGTHFLNTEERGRIFMAAVKTVEACPANDPVNPKKKFIADLRSRVAEKLELHGKQSEDLRVYSSLGTPLDLYFGADCFAALLDRATGKIHYVTLDFTLRDKKPSETEADIIIRDVPIPEFEPEKYNAQIIKWAGEVVKILRRRGSSPSNKPWIKSR